MSLLTPSPESKYTHRLFIPNEDPFELIDGTEPEVDSRIRKDENVPPHSLDAHIIRLLPDAFNMSISKSLNRHLDATSPDPPPPPERLHRPDLSVYVGYTTADRHSRVFAKSEKDDLVLVRVRKGDPVYLCLIKFHENGDPEWRYRDASGTFMGEEDIVWLRKYINSDVRMDAVHDLMRKHKDWMEKDLKAWQKSMRAWRQERRTIEAMIVQNEVELGNTHLFISWAACKSALPALDTFVTKENTRDIRGEISNEFSSKYEDWFYNLKEYHIDVLEEQCKEYIEFPYTQGVTLIELPIANMTKDTQKAYQRLYSCAAAIVDLKRQAERIERGKSASSKEDKLSRIELQVKEMSQQLEKKWEMRLHAKIIVKYALKRKNPSTSPKLLQSIEQWRRTIEQNDSS